MAKRPAKKDTGGRPGKLQDSQVEAVVKILRSGGSRANAASFIGVHYSTLKRACQRDASIAKKFRDAEAVGELDLVLKLRKLADSEFPALKFMLERKYWQTWGKKDPRSISPDQFASVIAQIMAIVVTSVPKDYHAKINDGIQTILRGLERMETNDAESN